MRKSSEGFRTLLKEIIGENIKELRKKKGFNQTKLGKIVNLTKQQLSLYETANNLPPIDVVIMLAKALDCSVADIYTPDKLDSLKNVFNFDEIYSK